MYIVLPAKVDGLDELLSRVDNSNINRMQFLLNLEEVKVSLPKFSIVNTVKLNEILKSVNIYCKIPNITVNNILFNENHSSSSWEFDKCSRSKHHFHSLLEEI